MKRITLALVSTLLSGAIYAQSLDMNLSNDTVEGAFEAPVTGTGFGKSYYDISVIFSERDEDNNWIAGGGFTVTGDAGSDVPGLELGVGVKVYAMEVAKFDVTAIPLGGHFRYAPPGMNRLFLRGALFWAPEIVTLYDGDEFVHSSVKLGYEILPTADVYVGYRDISIDIKNRDDEKVAANWMVGVTLTF